VSLVNEGHVDEALPVFGEVFAHDKVWADVLERLVPGEYFPADKELMKKVKATLEGK
jgi:hypothetical protein